MNELLRHAWRFLEIERERDGECGVFRKRDSTELGRRGRDLLAPRFEFGVVGGDDRARPAFRDEGARGALRHGLTEHDEVDRLWIEGRFDHGGFKERAHRFPHRLRLRRIVRRYSSTTVNT